MNRSQQDLRNYLCKLRQEKWQSYLTSLSTEDNSIWKAARRFKSKFTPFPPIQKINSNDYAYTDSDKADAIASSLELQFQLNNFGNPITDNEVNTTVQNFLNTTHTANNIKIHPLEIYSAIQSLKNKKSTRL